MKCARAPEFSLRYYFSRMTGVCASGCNSVITFGYGSTGKENFTASPKVYIIKIQKQIVDKHT